MIFIPVQRNGMSSDAGCYQEFLGSTGITRPFMGSTGLVRVIEVVYRTRP
jgi:hypothetical protein